MGRTVMIVDDPMFMRKILRGILVENGYIIAAEAASGIEAMRHLHTSHPDVILLDIILPDSIDLDLLESIITACPDSKVVVCSSIGEAHVIRKSLDLGARAYIHKPFTPETVTDVLGNLED